MKTSSEVAFTLILLISIQLVKCTFDSCNVNDTLCHRQESGSMVKNELNSCFYEHFDGSQCSEMISHNLNDDGRKNLGRFKIKWNRDGQVLNVNFADMKWNYAIIKFKLHDTKSVVECFKFTLKQNSFATFLNSDFCLNSTEIPNVGYAIEYEATKMVDFDKKTFVFFLSNLPDESDRIGDKQIFSYIEVSHDDSSLTLHIQPFPIAYHVNQYKIEIWREKNGAANFIDLRLISPDSELDDEIVFNFFTYNEEGSYYFLVSIISDVCPEDACAKSATPKIAIGRRGTPLVIGIVCASFIIPFVLFILYMWNKYRNQDNEEYKFSTENDVIQVEGEESGENCPLEGDAMQMENKQVPTILISREESSGGKGNAQVKHDLLLTQ